MCLLLDLREQFLTRFTCEKIKAFIFDVLTKLALTIEDRRHPARRPNVLHGRQRQKRRAHRPAAH